MGYCSRVVCWFHGSLEKVGVISMAREAQFWGLPFPLGGACPCSRLSVIWKHSCVACGVTSSRELTKRKSGMRSWAGDEF